MMKNFEDAGAGADPVSQSGHVPSILDKKLCPPLRGRNKCEILENTLNF